jgi:hypothetical protein
LVAFALLAPVALVACGKSDAKDVAVTSCKSDPTGGHPTADGTVTNHGKTPAIYRFTAEWDATAPKNYAVTQAPVMVPRVEPGQTVPWHADSIFNPVSPLTCRISPQTAKGLHLGHVGGPEVHRDPVP